MLALQMKTIIAQASDCFERPHRCGKWQYRFVPNLSFSLLTGELPMNANFLRGVIIFASTVLSSGSVLAEGVTLTEADMDSVTAGSAGGMDHYWSPFSAEFLKQFYLYLHLYGPSDNMAFDADSDGQLNSTAFATAYGMWTAVSANADVSNGMAVSSASSVSISGY
ncbi:MAG: hypothetical protein AB1648_00825 [Pseudomonadota bacterium]